MRVLGLSLLLTLAATARASADAIPGDDECGPGQHWEGGHDGQCSCAASPTHGSAAPLAPWLGAIAMVAIRRQRRTRI